MLKRLESLTPNIHSMVVYVQSPTLEYHIKGILREQFKVHRDFVVTADNAKLLREAKLDAFVAPFLCDKWLIHMNVDKLSKNELTTAFSSIAVHGIIVYWTTSYYLFKQMQDIPEVKNQRVHCPVFSFSRLSYNGIKYLYERICVGNENSGFLKDNLLHYVCNTYAYDVQSACDLFNMVKSGEEFQTQRDIIEAVGLGGNSVGGLTIKILLSGQSRYTNYSRIKPKPKTKSKKKKELSKEEQREKKLKTTLGKLVRQMNDLGATYKYSTIRNYMLSNIEGFIDMKQLQIMGVYNRFNYEIPETYNLKRLSMLKRYEWAILDRVTLPMLLNLKICLQRYSHYNEEVALIQGISDYLRTLSMSD